ncbi:hypothetical protein BU14_0311s0004 [Porphyra umbilicalis]|uniref:Uncharacterized protein n=1 Tax=Porphyra umbilicalis TaxID=2786 RepID=A0A1X6NZV2_PORUM|nr:hypothetical protein BU14_0311s0004 [Porphyra umbilicalis]|eukprot:OSX74065.1 hypothetical protein BU14_0311s0004 [Porphyra umbilicalis]
MRHLCPACNASTTRSPHLGQEGSHSVCHECASRSTVDRSATQSGAGLGKRQREVAAAGDRSAVAVLGSKPSKRALLSVSQSKVTPTPSMRTAMAPPRPTAVPVLPFCRLTTPPSDTPTSGSSCSGAASDIVATSVAAAPAAAGVPSCTTASAAAKLGAAAPAPAFDEVGNADDDAAVNTTNDAAAKSGAATLTPAGDEAGDAAGVLSGNAGGDAAAKLGFATPAPADEEGGNVGGDAAGNSMGGAAADWSVATRAPTHHGTNAPSPTAAPMRRSSFASQAAAAVALSRSAASGGRLFRPTSWLPTRDASPSRRPPSSPRHGTPSLPHPYSARPRQPHADRGADPPPAHGHSRPAPTLPVERDSCDETTDPAEFRRFSPHQVGAAISTFAGAQLSPVRQLELYNAFTLGAVDGNIVGIVAVQEDIYRVAEAVSTFYRRANDGRMPYGTFCRMLRFLRRMR